MLSLYLIISLLLYLTQKTRLGENQISKDGAIQSAGKVQKKNILHPKKKRKPLPNKEDKHELASVSPGQRWNSQFDDSEADFDENEADEDNLIINVESMANKGMALSRSTKRAKVSSKQVYPLIQLLQSCFFFLATSVMYLCTIRS